MGHEVSIPTSLTRSKGLRRYTSRVKPTKKVLLTITDHAPDVICRFDKDCRLLYVNPAIEKVTGIKSALFLNKSTRELGMPEQHSKDWEDGVSYVFSTGKQASIEFPFLTPKGLRYYQSVLVPEYDTAGNIETVLSISRDITSIREKDKQKEEVVGFVSHELKTPVSSLKMFTQLLQQRFIKAGDLATASHMAKMDLQLNKLTNIISDLTEATRIENDSMKLQKKKFDFYLLVAETVEEVQKTTDKHNIIILGSNGKKVFGDRFRIGQVLTNLLTNAIKYSPDSSDILVKITSVGKRVVCSVQDKGMGIAKAKQKKIFERFYRVLDSQQKSNMGLGLGLYISAEIIKRHNGRIRVKSIKGKGSTFTFTLPIVEFLPPAQMFGHIDHTDKANNQRNPADKH